MEAYMSNSDALNNCSCFLGANHEKFVMFKAIQIIQYQQKF